MSYTPVSSSTLSATSTSASALLPYIAVVDQSGHEGEWQFKEFVDDTAELLNTFPFTPPMSPPLALIWDESSQSAVDGRHG